MNLSTQVALLNKLRIACFVVLGTQLLAACGEMLPSEGGDAREMKTLRRPIVGGTVANHADWPWIVSLQREECVLFWCWYEHSCGGTLIAEDWVLTAEHCGTPDRVLVGPDPATAIERTIANRIPHPERDIALLRLSSSVPVIPAPLNLDNGFPSEIPLASATIDVVTNARIAGWGATTQNGASPSYPELREAALPAVTGDTCYGGVLDSELCVGYVTGGVSGCYGDSGGPLAYDFGVRVLAGATSWGSIYCAQPNSPTVYARVSSSVPWIEDNGVPVTKFSPTAIITTVLF